MKKIIILRSLFGYLLVLIIHLGILYISFNYFNVNSNGTIAISPAMYLTFAVIIISLAYFTWRAITQYSSLSEYLKTAEQLKIELNSSLSDVSFSPTPFDKFNYDNYFVGGLAGEGLYQTNNESIKILHLFQSGGIFFPQLFGSKCITVFETKFSDTSLCFILRRKNLSTTLNSVDSSLLKGWEYFFFDKFKKLAKNELITNIEELIPKKLTKELIQLPGKNVILVQHGKIRLIHDGFLKNAEEVTTFAKSLANILH